MVELIDGVRIKYAELKEGKVYLKVEEDHRKLGAEYINLINKIGATVKVEKLGNNVLRTVEVRSHIAIHDGRVYSECVSQEESGLKICSDLDKKLRKDASESENGLGSFVLISPRYIKIIYVDKTGFVRGEYSYSKLEPK